MAVRDLEVLTASHSKTPCRYYWLKSEAYESSWRKVLKPTMHCDLDLKNNLVGLPVHHPSLPADLKARSLDGWTPRRGREGKILVLSSLSQVERLSDSHYYTWVYFFIYPFCAVLVQLLMGKLFELKLFSLLDLQNGGISTEEQQVMSQLEEKLDSLNKFATEAYNSVISSSQVVCFLSL